MNYCFQKRLAKFLALLLFVFSPYFLCAEKLEALGKSHKILMIYSYTDAMPWQKNFKKGFHTYLSSSSRKIDVFEENLDIVRFHTARDIERFAEYLASKYENMHFDKVVVESGAATNFLEEHPDFLPDTERLFVNPSPKVVHALHQKHQKNYLAVEGDLPRAFRELIDIFHPKKVVVVGETRTKISKELLRDFKKYQKDFTSAVKVEYILDLPMDKLLERVSTLPSDAVILYTLIFEDGAGQKFIPFVAAKRIAKHASVPVFSHWDTLMGSGIVGGYMLSGYEIGKICAQKIIDRSSSSGEDVPQNETIFKHIYDWHILKKFHFPLEGIPKGASILHKEGSLWENHKKKITGIVALLILFAFWIVVLRHQVNERTKELKEQKEEAEKVAVTDHLTGLPNRFAIESLLKHEMRQHSRNNEPICLLMLDIDYFKKINDTYGHHTGDEVLKLFSGTLKLLMRSSDHFARWGGEEFMVLVPMSEAEDALQFSQKLRVAIEELKHPTLPAFTISIGVGQYQAGQTFKEWYESADEALYRAKESGRNCVST